MEVVVDLIGHVIDIDDDGNVTLVVEVKDAETDAYYSFTVCTLRARDEEGSE